jgi:hypothetical protein
LEIELEREIRIEAGQTPQQILNEHLDEFAKLDEFDAMN